MVAGFATDFAAGLAANLADKVVVAGAGALQRWALGTDEQQALRRCFESAFKHMLANLGASEDERQQVGEVFRHALTSDTAAEALLKTALAPDPSSDALRTSFHEAGLDPETLGADADTALSLLVEGLETALRMEAASPGSPLFNRIQLGDLYALRLTLARIAGCLGDAGEWWRAQLPRAAPRSIRLDNFFADYLGLPGRPVPFGGRTADIAILNRWLGDPAKWDRMLLTAPAGRGKSALLAQWARQIPPGDHAVVMVPISLRYGTAEKQAFYAAFAERLGDLYGDPLPANKLGDVTYCEGHAHRLLEQPLPNGRSLVVVIDGLDEATDWEPERVLFPAHVRAGLCWVLSARELGDDVDPQQGWLRRLGWDRYPPLAETITLERLDVVGVAEAAASLGAPLDTLATRPEIVKRLHELTEGDPLLVRFYVEDIWKKVDGGAVIAIEDLDRLKPGYLGYFVHWWEDQRRQWPGNQPEQDVKVALALLACARGPLPEDDLGALAEDYLGDYLEARKFDGVETLRRIRRFLSGDAQDVGWFFQHPKLAELFRDGGALDRRLVGRADAAYHDWGNATLHEFGDGRCAPAKAPVYLLRHLLAHLLAADAPVEDLMAVTQIRWLRARQAGDGSDEGIAYDLTRIRDALVRRCAESGRPCFNERYRIALFLSSIHSVSSNVPAQLLLAALDVKLITPRQALHLARSDPDNMRRSRKLTMLVPHLPADERPRVIDEALAAARTIGDDRRRAEVLTTLALRLVPDKRAAVLDEALAAARALRDEVTIRGEVGHALAIWTLAPHLSAEQLIEALAAARAIADDGRRAEALTVLVAHLPADERPRAVAEALEAAQAVGDDQRRAEALTVLVAHLPADERPRVVAEALEAAQAIQDEDNRVPTLVGLARRLSAEQLGEALAAAQAIRDEDDRVRTLKGLAPHLPADERPRVIDEALAAARTIRDERARAEALTTLVAHLPADERPRAVAEALEAARAVGDERQRAHALAGLTPHLWREQLDEALAAGRAIEDEGARAEVLSALALHLTPDERAAVLAEALPAASEIGHEGERAKALAAWAPHLSPEQLGEALAAAAAIADEWTLARALAALAPHLSPEQLGKALTTAQAISHEGACAKALAALAPHLSAEQLGEALAMAQAIKYEQDRAHALTAMALAPLLPVNKRAGVLDQALEAARAIGDTYSRAHAMVALALHLAPNKRSEVLKKALAAAQAIGDEMYLGNALAALAPHLSGEQQEAAIADFLASAENVYRGHVLHCTESVLASALFEPTAMVAAIIDAQAMWP